MGQMEIFSIRLKQLREELKMSQRDFAKLVNITQQTLSGYERCVIKPPLDIAKHIADKCNVSLDWLTGLSNDKDREREIRNYKDVALMIIKLLHLEDYTESGLLLSFQLICNEITGEANHTIAPGYTPLSDALASQIDCKLAPPQRSEFINFLDTFKKLSVLLDKKQITQEVIDTWLKGALSNLETIPISESDNLPFQDESDLFFC